VLEQGWNVLMQDESIFAHDSGATKKRKWISKQRRPIVDVIGSHSKTIIFGVLSLNGKLLFRQYDRFDSHSFITHLEAVRKKFKKFIMFADSATQHRSRIVKEYLQRNGDDIMAEYFPVGSPEFNAVEECWRQGKYNLLSEYYPNFQSLKQVISNYYRTIRFNLNIKKYLLRSMN
jgi:transposase